MTEPTDSEREAQFRQWFATEERRREALRLRGEISRLERTQLASSLLVLFWVFATGIGYRVRPDIVPAEVAGIITLTVFVGGGLIIWYVNRLKREHQRRLDAMKLPE